MKIRRAVMVIAATLAVASLSARVLWPTTTARPRLVTHALGAIRHSSTVVLNPATGAIVSISHGTTVIMNPLTSAVRSVSARQ